MTIHREGHRLLISMLIVLVFFNAGVFYISDSSLLALVLSGSASLIIYLLVLQFFRNPSRKQNLGDWVLCPADGKIVAIEKVFESEYYKDERIQVSVFMSPLNVHINRFSISGKVVYFKYHEGLYLIASHPKSSTENERTTVVVENGTQSVLLRQIAGYVARRVLTYCKVGDAAKQGGEFGFIKFGSRVDILLPLSANIEVQLGQIVKGGITRIANFNA